MNPAQKLIDNANAFLLCLNRLREDQARLEYYAFHLSQTRFHESAKICAKISEQRAQEIALIIEDIGQKLGVES